MIYIDNQNSYGSLAEAVVLQAVKDYRRSYRTVLINPSNRAAAQMMKECERFIESGWFGILCGLDPEELLYRIDSETEKAHYRRTR